MRHAYRLLVLAFVASICLSVRVRAAQTSVSLSLTHQIASPGETVWAGVRLKMPGNWHTYWENGGDSGAATELDWTLPEGITAGEILWPVPEKLPTAGLVTYVYHHEAVLVVPLSIAPDAPKGLHDIKAKVSWLECDKLCVAANGQISAKLEIGETTKLTAAAAERKAWLKKLPQAKPAAFARAWWEGEPQDDTRFLLIEWTANPAAKQFDFYPGASAEGEVRVATERVKAEEPGKVRVRKEVDKIETGWPVAVSGLVIEKTDAGEQLGAYHVELPIEGDEIPAASAVTSGKSLVGWLGLAFLGGLILNLMPCVLPVIALKVFGFVSQSRESPARVRQLGIIYGLGVIASFLVLAGMIVGLKTAGQQVSWGMQFGDPRFLVIMTTLVTLVALNLFGLFEVTLGSSAMGAASNLASGEGAGGAFFNGILATALSTPCTAPALAGALGFAFLQPPVIIIVMFLTVGLGLAAPYVLLSFQPSWLKFLPKPGAWMEKFKVAMGFPMLATAVWLFSLTVDHYPNVVWFGIFLVCLALATWIFGQFVQRGVSRKGLGLAFACLFLAIGYGYALEKELNWRTRPEIVASTAGAAGETVIQHGPDGIRWRPWSSQAVQEARANGNPVFVDFTADWCLTCKFNTKTSIEIDEVRQKLNDIGAVTLLGDYTRVPEDITKELARFKKAGVPLVLVYPKDASKPPIELPSLLTPSIVLDALDKAAN